MILTIKKNLQLLGRCSLSLVRVRSDPRTGPDLLVRADQLFGPWIPDYDFNKRTNFQHKTKTIVKEKTPDMGLLARILGQAAASHHEK